MQKKSSGKKVAPPPRIPYEKIKFAILGSAYDLSIASVSALKAQALNKKYRGKSYVPDVLAFPLSKTEGEIVLNRKAIIREARRRGVSLTCFASHAFIHACLHLNGYGHGKSMEKKELFYIKKLHLKI